MREDFPEGFVFILANQGLYVAGILFNVVALLLVRHYKTIINLAYVYTGVLVIFSFFGISLFHEMFQLQRNDHSYRKLYEVYVSMICIRLAFYALICFFFGCISVFMCCAIASGQ
mmetsp:Transcript_4230/g.7179  ORF Transcript_4230/g.7179 Transcript_4230/m.7179 type:complete len:115 (+) Transcript_4230:754-1098(+)